MDSINHNPFAAFSRPAPPPDRDYQEEQYQPSPLAPAIRGTIESVMQIGDMLPNSLDAEQGVLGSILLAPSEVMPLCLDAHVEMTWFRFPANQLIFEEIADCWDAGHQIDFILLTQRLRDRKILEKCGGPSYVTALFTIVPTSANASQYIAILREKWVRCQLMLACDQWARAAHNLTNDDPEMIVEALKTTLNSLTTIEPKTEVRSISEIWSEELDPGETLLGQRFLCRDGALCFVGPSGIGKSSSAVQMFMLWGLGRPAFDIAPAKPLKTLVIQAENDGGDLQEMARGVVDGLALSDDDLLKLHGNLFYSTVRALVGDAFLREVESLLRKHRPDLLNLDPLMAYLGADVNDARATALFLRSGLNPLLEKYHCAAMVSHHTPKVTNRDTSGWRASDWAYACAGSHDITNWARAILVIDPTHANHVFRFVAAKRGSRIGWADDAGEITLERHFCHARRPGFHWRPANAQDLEAVESAKEQKVERAKTKRSDSTKKFEKSFTVADILFLMGKESNQQRWQWWQLQKHCQEMIGMSKATFGRLFSALTLSEKLKEHPGKQYSIE